MSQSSVNALCPCGSSVKYKRCCQRFHNGLAAASALELMKSRYSAYAVGVADYIINTTHPDCPEYDKDRARWVENIGRFSRGTDFEGLTILAFEDGTTHASVTFRAQLRQGSADASFAEKSEFVALAGRWLYLSGSRV
jgi:SEC-C motif-containing protein